MYQFLEKVLVICGSEWQIPLVQKLNSLNFEVIVFNIYSDSPAFKFAAHWEIVDILDLQKCLKLAKKYEPVAVFSDQSDIAVKTVATVSQGLGVKGITGDKANLCTNKLLMRKHCDAHGFRQPAYTHCTSFPNFRDTVLLNNGELVVKPLDSNSSRGVELISRYSDFDSTYQNAIQYNRGGSGVLLEEYITGSEYTADGIIINGAHKTLAISKKKHFSYNHSIACELYFSWTDPEVCYSQLTANNDLIYNSLGLTEGTLTHAEYKFRDGHFYLIEFAARGGGNLISSHIVPFMCQFDNYKHHITSRLPVQGDLVSSSFVYDTERSAVLRFFDISEQGLIISIEGEELLRADKRVIAFHFNYSPGDLFSFAHDDAGRLGYYIAVGSSTEDLQDIINLVDSGVRITVDNTFKMKK